MRYITLLTVTTTPEGPPPPELMSAIAQLGKAAEQAGALVDTAGIDPSSAGVELSLTGGNVQTSAPSGRSCAPSSYAIYDVASQDQAVEWTKRFLSVHAQHWPEWEAEASVLKVLGPEDFGPQ